MAPGRGLDPGLARALDSAFRQAGRPAPAILSFTALSGGSINRAFRLDTPEGPLFCKWNPDAPADFFVREREGLEAMACADTSLILPRVLAGGALAGGVMAVEPAIPGGSGYPTHPTLSVLVLEWLDPAVGPVAQASWEALGHGLADLHRKGADRFGFPSDNYCGLTPQENGWMDGWAAFHGERRIGALVRRLQAAGRLGKREAEVFHKLSRRLPALLAHEPVPSLLHGDLWSGNFLASARGPALIDPAAYFGDREADWAMMLLFGGFPDAVLSAYQESWPLPAGWRERLPLYQLYPVLNHFLLFGGGYGEQAMRIASRHI